MSRPDIQGSTHPPAPCLNAPSHSSSISAGKQPSSQLFGPKALQSVLNSSGPLVPYIPSASQSCQLKDTSFKCYLGSGPFLLPPSPFLPLPPSLSTCLVWVIYGISFCNGLLLLPTQFILHIVAEWSCNSLVTPPLQTLQSLPKALSVKAEVLTMLRRQSLRLIPHCSQGCSVSPQRTQNTHPPQDMCTGAPLFLDHSSHQTSACSFPGLLVSIQMLPSNNAFSDQELKNSILFCILSPNTFKPLSLLSLFFPGHFTPVNIFPSFF